MDRDRHDNRVDEDDLDENEVSFFKCRKCGSRVFEVTELSEVTAGTEVMVPCDCGKHEWAAQGTVRKTTSIKGTGYLRGDRHYVIEEHEELDVLDTEDDVEVLCQECYSKADESSSEEEEGQETVEESSEVTDVTITCGGCGREIEFGYSHPDGGRIFLGQDDVDFNPWLTFPDHKYVDAWRKRGWLRPPRGERAGHIPPEADAPTDSP